MPQATEYVYVCVQFAGVEIRNNLAFSYEPAKWARMLDHTNGSLEHFPFVVYEYGVSEWPTSLNLGVRLSADPAWRRDELDEIRTFFPGAVDVRIFQKESATAALTKVPLKIAAFPVRDVA